MRGQPGTKCKMSYDLGADAEEFPEVGDFLFSPRTGATYLIDRVSHSPSIAGRIYAWCTRLELHAVSIDQEGVWPIYWHPRKRRGD